MGTKGDQRGPEDLQPQATYKRCAQRAALTGAAVAPAGRVMRAGHLLAVCGALQPVQLARPGNPGKRDMKLLTKRTRR